MAKKSTVKRIHRTRSTASEIAHKVQTNALRGSAPRKKGHLTHERLNELADKAYKDAKLAGAVKTMAKDAISSPKECNPAKPPRPLNAREAVYGLFSFLTTRQPVLSFGGHHDCAPIAEVVGAYCDVNKLPKLRDDWKYKAPEGFETITNERTSTATVNAEPLDPLDAVKRIVHLLDCVPHEKRNAVIAYVLKDQRDRNGYSQRCAKRQIKNSMEHLQTLQDRSRELDLIRQGQVVTL